MFLGKIETLYTIMRIWRTTIARLTRVKPSTSPPLKATWKPSPTDLQQLQVVRTLVYTAMRMPI